MKEMRLAWNVVEITPERQRQKLAPLYSFCAWNTAVTCTFVQERAATGSSSAPSGGRRSLTYSRRDGKVVAARLVGSSASRRTRSGATCASSRPRGSSSACTAARSRPRRSPDRSPAAARRRGEKAALAEAAVAVLGQARVVLLDGSTTNLEVARRLPAGPARTVLTNSPPIAAALAEHPTAEVVMIGGRLDKRAQVTVGAMAVDFIRSVRADACVLGVCALHPEAGLSTDDLEEARSSARWSTPSADVIARHVRQAQRRQPVPRRSRSPSCTHVVAEAAAPDELLDPYRAARRHGDARMSRRAGPRTGVFVVNGAAIGTWVAQIPGCRSASTCPRARWGSCIVGMASRWCWPSLRRPGDRPLRLGADGVGRRHRLRARRHAARARAQPLLVALGLVVLGAGARRRTSP